MTDRPPVTSTPPLWERIPASLKWAVVTAVLGFVVSVSFSSRSTANGRVTECSYVDVGALAFAALTVVLVGVGLRAELTKKHDRLRMPIAVLLALVAILVLAVVLHVLAGFGSFSDYCS